MNGIVEAHRQLIAYIMKRSPLQIWAMIDPANRFWRDVAEMAAPPFSDPAIVRMKIEGFVAGKQWLFPDPTQMLPPLSFETPMVIANPTTASVFHTPEYVNDSLVAQVNVQYCVPDDPASSPYAVTRWASYNRGESTVWTYQYDPDLEQWLLLDRPGSSFRQG